MVEDCSAIDKKGIRFNRVGLAERPCYHIFRVLTSGFNSVVQLEKHTGTEYKMILTMNIFLYTGRCDRTDDVWHAGSLQQENSHSLAAARIHCCGDSSNLRVA